MTGLNGIDYFILAIFGLSLLAGLIRGFVREFIGLVTWIVAFLVAIWFAPRLAAVFTNSQGVSAALSNGTAATNTSEPTTFVALGISFILIFIAVVIIGKIFNFFIGGGASGSIGFINRLLGGIFGLIRGALATVIMIFLVQLTSYADQDMWKQSQLVPVFEPVVQAVDNAIEPDLVTLKKKAASLSTHFSGG